MSALPSVLLLLSLLSPASDSKGAFLGVELRDDPGRGVTITRVIEGTPAAAAELRAGDVLVAIDGRDVHTIADLRRVLGAHAPGDEVTLLLCHDAESSSSRRVELAPRPARESGTPERARHVLEVLDVGPGDVVADIGCGSGWLSKAVAEVVGPAGRVHAVDVDEDCVEAVRARDLPGVVAVHSAARDVRLPERSIDVAFLHDVASHVDEDARGPFYASIARALKPDGVLVVFGRHGRTKEMLAELHGFGFVPEHPEELEGLAGQPLDDRFWAGIRFRRVVEEARPRASY